MTTLSQMLQKARAIVARKGVPPDDVDDLVHEAFLRLEMYERTHAVRSREALLVHTAVNLAIDRQRRNKRSPFDASPVDLNLVIDQTPGQDMVIEVQEKLGRLTEGMAALPERTRRILLARRIDGKSYGHIAAEENMSVSAVEKQVARATLTLMRWMDGW